MKITRLVAAATLGLGSMLVLAVPSHAAAAQDCKTVTATMDRPDSRPGGFWADDSFSRTATVCRLPETDLKKSSVEIKTDQYSVSVADEGTFKTKGTVSFKGHLMKPGLVGAFKGNLGNNVSFQGVVTAPHDWGFWNGKNPGNLDADHGTSAWIVKLWDDGATLNEGAHWGWDYVTCNEKLTNASAGNSGDITGYNLHDYSKCISVSFLDNCDGTVVVVFASSGGIDVYGVISGKDDKVLVAAGQKVNAAPVMPTDGKATVTAQFKIRDKFFPVPGVHKTHTWVKPKDCVTPSTSASAPGPQPSGSTPATGGSLPVTGPNIWVISGAGIVLLVGGFFVVRAARRHKEIKFTA